MSDSDDFLPVKRGRPKKITDKNQRKTKGNPYSSGVAMSRHHSDLQKSYAKENYSQKIRNMITRIPFVVNLPNNILQLQLQNFLEESTKQLMISELELVGFTLVLERLLQKNLNMHPEELLKTCFFISKNVFESNEETLLTIKSSLKCQFKNFEANLIRLSEGMSFSTFEINKRYKEIENCRYSIINYTYFVDNIIRQSPPYKTSEKNYNNPDKNHVKVEERKMEQEIDNESKKLDPDVEEAFNDQQSALDYYNLMPIEDNEFHIRFDDEWIQKFIEHPSELLNEEIPILEVENEDEDDIGMLLSLS